jgi:hypothetical protein
MNASLLSRLGLHFGFVDHMLPVASYYLRPCFPKNFPYQHPGELSRARLCHLTRCSLSGKIFLNTGFARRDGLAFCSNCGKLLVFAEVLA